MTRLLFLIFLLLITPPFLSAAPLDQRIESILSRGSAARAVWGFYAADLASGDTLADINGTRLLVPASNRKLVTTAMTLDRLSPADTFRTTLRTEEVSPAGQANGDLVLHATGDPTWIPELLGGRPGQMKIRELARQAASSGLRRVAGDLVVDTGRFRNPSPIPPGWTWDNLDASYASLPAVFSVNANLAAITIRPTRPGAPLDIKPTIPEAFQLNNQTVTLGGGSAPTFQIIRRLDGRELTLTGGVPVNSGSAVRSIPLGGPAEVNAQMLRRALDDEGITIEGEVVLKESVEEGTTLLGVVEGATIAETIKACNQESHNFLAESLYLLSAADRYGRASYRSAHRLEEEFWREIGAGSDHVHGVDGSGLARENAITAEALVQLLAEMQENAVFTESLPISGRSGTLRYRLAQNGMAGRVRAKTGTLDGVSALSGYVTTNSGRTVAFSIMANNYTSSTASIRRTIDEIVTILAAR